MRTFMILPVVTLLLLRTAAWVAAEPVILQQGAPAWKVGDSWTFRTEKLLDRIATQNAGMLVIATRLEKVENITSYTVSGTETIEGEECYALRFTGSQTITGRYNLTQAEGETGGGSLVERVSLEGTEYRRTSDLAFVKALIRSRGTVEVGGMLGGIPAPVESNSIITASPPLKQFTFPLIKGEGWRVTSVVTTVTSGTSSDTTITTFNYGCTVIGPRTATLENGKTFECIVIDQEGTQTTQSQNSGVTIEEVRGLLLFAPAVGYFVSDEAEGVELLEYVPAKSPTKE